MSYRLTDADRELIATAVHEAGHAVAAVVLGGRVHTAAIDDHPRTEYDVLPERARALVAYAGPWCEARWFAGRHPGPADMRTVLATSGRHDDKAMMAVGGPAAGLGIVPLLERCWPSIKSVARSLVQDDEVGHNTVCAALGLADDGGPGSSALAWIRSGGTPGSFVITNPASARVGTPFQSVDRINVDG